MRIEQIVSQDEVWHHWMLGEGFTSAHFRNDIRDPLPKDLRWYLATVEQSDLSRLFIISSGDWFDITRGSFRVIDVAERVHVSSDHKDTQRILTNIIGKIEYLESGGILDTRLIAVTCSTDLSGPFTIIEGNRRAVALAFRNGIVGCRFYIGVSPAIRTYLWATMMYNYQATIS